MPRLPSQSPRNRTYPSSRLITLLHSSYSSLLRSCAVISSQIFPDLANPAHPPPNTSHIIQDGVPSADKDNHDRPLGHQAPSPTRWHERRSRPKARSCRDECRRYGCHRWCKHEVPSVREEEADDRQVGYTPDMLREQVAELKGYLDDKNAPFGVDLLLPQVGGSARKTK